MRYFFNLAGAVTDRDNEGIEFATLSDARIHAVKHGAEYLCDRPELVWLGEEFRIEVTNKSGHVCFTFVAVGVDGAAQEGRLRI